MDEQDGPPEQSERELNEDSETSKPPRSNPNPIESLLRYNGELTLFLRDTLQSIAVVAVIGLLLFALSGVWPPMVAVESGSMEPHMEKDDLIYITGPDHFTASASSADGPVVTHQEAVEDDYRSLGGYGSVVVFKDPERSGPPIIHRAHFHVDEGENWYDEANKSYVSADNCEELLNCPAPHSGYITKGDNNARYDQASGIYPVVKPRWVDGIARVRVPYLGCIRLGVGENSCLRAS